MLTKIIRWHFHLSKSLMLYCSLFSCQTSIHSLSLFFCVKHLFNFPSTTKLDTLFAAPYADAWAAPLCTFYYRYSKRLGC